MITKEKTVTEILDYAAEMLTWDLPLEITKEKLIKIKAVAASAITQTHNHLKEVVNPLNKIVIKPRISIGDLVKLNQFIKSPKSVLR